MATCTVKNFVPVPPPKTYVLELTEAEAATLYQVTKNIAGTPGGARGLTDGIHDALYIAGVESTKHQVTGFIRFV